MAATAESSAAAPVRARAVARYVRMSPTKVRRVVALIKDRPLQEALDILRFSPQAAAVAVKAAMGMMLRCFALRAWVVFIGRAPALYCASVTFSIHSTFLLLTVPERARCVMAVVGDAPCQCLTPGGHQMTSPALAPSRSTS